jgi:hypothetical protein
VNPAPAGVRSRCEENATVEGSTSDADAVDGTKGQS